jgi:hypothetical protein
MLLLSFKAILPFGDTVLECMLHLLLCVSLEHRQTDRQTDR